MEEVLRETLDAVSRTPPTPRSMSLTSRSSMESNAMTTRTTTSPTPRATHQYVASCGGRVPVAASSSMFPSPPKCLAGGREAAHDGDRRIVDLRDVLQRRRVLQGGIESLDCGLRLHPDPSCPDQDCLYQGHHDHDHRRGDDEPELPAEQDALRTCGGHDACAQELQSLHLPLRPLDPSRARKSLAGGMASHSVGPRGSAPGSGRVA